VKAIDLVGFRFGRLTVIGPAPHFLGAGGRFRTAWQCRCDCGNVIDVATTSLRAKNTRSCGCLAAEVHADVIRQYHGAGEADKNYRHGARARERHSSTYTTWAGIKKRAKKLSLEFCPRWTKFERFLFDMGERQEGMKLVRIDTEIGYNKENCRWAADRARRKPITS